MLNIIVRIKNAFNPEINRSDLLTLLRGMSVENVPKERIESLQGLMYWIRLPVRTTEEIQVQHAAFHDRNVRFKFLMQFLERNPTEAEHFISVLRDFTDRGKAIRLFCLTGVSENNNFFSELKERIAQNFFPLAYGENDLAEVFKSIFTEEADAIWIEECYEVILPPLMALIGSNSIRTELLLHDLQDAMIILTSQISSIGTTREIRRRLEDTNLASSHFIRLGRAVWQETPNDRTILQEVSHCRIQLQKIKDSLETSGVSVDLIYQMEKLSSLMDRLEMLIYLKDPADELAKQRITALFVGRLIRAEIRRTGIGEFLQENLQMLTKKIVERAGEKGDYYIANTREEKKSLMSAGAWAGVLTAFAALFKTLIGQAQYPFLIEGILFFFNYSVIFLLMQRWHLALSSKLPAYTASALSKKFEEFLRTKEIDTVMSEVKKISKSQFIAAVGNLIWVVPVCIGIDWFLYFTTGSHLYSTNEAYDTIRKHDLIASGTMFYAFITGIFLWFSSLITGAVENWLVFRKFPEIIQDSPTLYRLFSKEKIAEFSEKLPATLGAVAGNLSISAFLAFPVVIGKITGLPLDIRHVTLSSGSLTFAFNTLGWNYELWPYMISMTLSILVMGILNFGVSFYCALKLAATARNVDSRYVRIIFKFLFFGKKRD